MKNNRIALTFLIVAAATGLLFAAAPANIPGDNDKEKCVIKVEGMTCSYCAKTVETTLNKDAGVSSVDVDLATGLATATDHRQNTTP